MDHFSTRLDYRGVLLDSAIEIVRFSFIVHNSISHLDLALCQHSTVLYRDSCGCFTSKLSNRFIDTEEKCRKYFSPSRSFLYTLHLDLPKGREYSLKDAPMSTGYCRDTTQHIGEIIPSSAFDILILSSFINDATDIYNEKQKLLAWILKFSKKHLLYLLDIKTVDKFISCIYPEFTDSLIFKDFIIQLNFINLMMRYEKPEILEYLLYYARFYGREDDFPFDEIIDLLILYGRFLNIGSILKYVNAPSFTEDSNWLYYDKISFLRPSLTIKVLIDAEKWMKRERVHQILQIFWMHIKFRHHHRVEAASEALRLIWCSVPDAYISFEEIEKAFLGVCSIEELKNVYDFYATSVGMFYERVQPRSLQHLCRSMIRKTLREKQIWIPEGLRQTGLPKSLQPFLNLEKK